MRLAGVLVAGTLVVATAAWAKESPPGNLMICGATQCRTASPAQCRAFSSLLWGDRPVNRAPTPRVGSPVYQLRFPNGPVGAIINATAIRVHGLNCGRFQQGKWYRLPPALRGVTEGLRPKRLRASIPPSC